MEDALWVQLPQQMLAQAKKPLLHLLSQQRKVTENIYHWNESLFTEVRKPVKPEAENLILFIICLHSYSKINTNGFVLFIGKLELEVLSGYQSNLTV